MLCPFFPFLCSAEHARIFSTFESSLRLHRGREDYWKEGRRNFVELRNETFPHKKGMLSVLSKLFLMFIEGFLKVHWRFIIRFISFKALKFHLTKSTGDMFKRTYSTFIFKGAWRRGSVMKQVFRMTLEVSSSLGRSESQLNFSFKGFAPGTFNFSMSRG